MKRTTISLPDGLAMRLDRERRRRGVPVAAIVREALEAHLGGGSSSGRGRSPRLWFVGLGRSGHDNVAQDAEEILARAWDRTLPAGTVTDAAGGIAPSASTGPALDLEPGQGRGAGPSPSESDDPDEHQGFGDKETGRAVNEPTA